MKLVTGILHVSYRNAQITYHFVRRIYLWFCLVLRIKGCCFSKHANDRLEIGCLLGIMDQMLLPSLSFKGNLL
jgi:hypothetical protein